MLLYNIFTAGEFVWNEGGVVPATCYLLPAPYITMCDFLALSPIFLAMIEIWSLNLQVKYADCEVNKTLTSALPKGSAHWLFSFPALHFHKTKDFLENTKEIGPSEIFDKRHTNQNYFRVGG
jgi:hypothetical protein